MIKKILVAYDNGVKAQKALDTAIEIASGKAAEIYIVTSVKMPETIESIADRDMLKKLEGQTKSYFESILDEAAEKVKKAGIPVHVVLLDKSPGEGIIRFAEEENIDLIAMGSHNRGPLERFLLGMGSVANYVINHSKCLVLITKA